MSETVPIKEHNHRFDLYDADGCLVGKANPGKKVMLADAFYVPERTCRNLNPPSCRDFECSECGESSEFTPGFMPNYCPNCGARVVEEASDDDDR